MLNSLELFALNLEIEEWGSEIFEAIFDQSHGTLSPTVASDNLRDLWLVLANAVDAQVQSPLKDQLQENMGL